MKGGVQLEDKVGVLGSVERLVHLNDVGVMQLSLEKKRIYKLRKFHMKMNGEEKGNTMIEISRSSSVLLASVSFFFLMHFTAHTLPVDLFTAFFTV